MIDSYSQTLQIYGFKNILSAEKPETFNERIDSLVVLICRTCPHLRHLMINDSMSTSTVLLSAHTASNLERLYIRKSKILVKCDWPKNPDWDNEFYSWLKSSSKKIASTEKEISQILGYNFQFLDDHNFDLFDLDVKRL
uniref:CSON012035 protein n=1 Tax=Culicoides sonorensis TaxID=179676 RepID=A0A336N1Z6_CULSO